jgi:RNA polymerase sigma factor (sigma-70 family)
LKPFTGQVGLISRRSSGNLETYVEELRALVIRVKGGDSAAYEAIVQRFQDMAVGYSYALLGDIQLAEDAAQEAFLKAYFDLPSLRDPAAFPGWFRQIVFKQVDRLRRGKRNANISLNHLPDMASPYPSPADLIETYEVQERVFAAIETLSEPQRQVITLFYMGEYSHQEISAFLDIPISTIKMRLYHARQHLKEKIRMVQDNLSKQRPSRDNKFTEKVAQLFKATVQGDATLVKTLLAKDPALARATGPADNPLWGAETSVLHLAVMYGRKDIIDLLLAHGADINEKDEKYGFTALHHAVDLADFLPDYAALGMVDFLMAAGAKPDIFVFLWLGDDEGVKTLLEKEPDSANRVGPNKVTPLCYARSVKMAQLLLDHGADMFARLEEGAGFTTPLRWATHYPTVLHFLLNQASIEIDIFLACVLGDTAQVETALKATPSLANARTGTHHVLEPDLTPLHLTAQYGHTGIAKLLLDAGADINAKAPAVKNMTPLHLAVWRGRKKELDTLLEISQSAASGALRLLPEMPRLLLDHGADVTARDSDKNLTPLGWAEAKHEDETDRSEVVELLKAFSAK